MTDWASLHDGYGDPAAVPATIERLVDAPSHDLWSNLWGHLCHQGTVYSASFAAIPLLYQTCPRLAPADRRGALMLIGAIMASTDRHLDAAPDETVLELLPDLLRITEAAMGEPDVDEAEFAYLLQAALPFRGDAIWHRVLDGLASNDLQGWCPECPEHMFILPSDAGYVAVGHGNTRNPAAARNPVMPISTVALPRAGAWLHGKAMQHGKLKTARTLTHIFGKVACPECGATIQVARALLRIDQGKE